MYKKWMDNNDTFVYACYPNYTDVKKYDNDIAAAKIAELELKYKSLSEDEKSAMLRKNYVRLKQDLYAKYKILEDADFYAEAYAEIGAYILAGSNSNISAGTGSKTMDVDDIMNMETVKNDDDGADRMYKNVLDKYSKLYKKIFYVVEEKKTSRFNPYM